MRTTPARLVCITADEAAAMIPHGATVGFSGFTPAGAAKAVPRALAARAREAQQRGEAYQIRVLTGASTGPSLDEELASAGAIAWRAPYQSSKSLRQQINTQEAEFVEMHLSHVPAMVEFGFLGKIDVAVVEAVDVTPDGRIFLSTSIGASPTFLRHADKIFVEINRHHSMRVQEMHDIFILPRPPYRTPTGIHGPLCKVGRPYVQVNPAKIAGIIETNEPDHVNPFDAPDEVSNKIAQHVVKFILDEMKAGRIPNGFLPMQSGVGNVANAVLAGLGDAPEIPPFQMFTEVFQDAAADLMARGRLTGASSTSLTLSEERLQMIYADMDYFAPKIVLRPQDMSNHPGVVRRLGIISINTVLEMDIYGCANSTHVCGTQLMNGVGGSGDFVRNAYLSFLVAPSVAKGGKISTVVPMVTHVDHNEHSTQIFVTEQGLADLRGLGPVERAKRMINNCAHPMYRDYLNRYLEEAPVGHIRHDLGKCFELHLNLQRHGTMLPV